MTLALIFLGLVVSPLSAQEPSPSVTVLTVDATITPIVATYIDRGIDSAVDRGDDAVHHPARHAWRSFVGDG